MRLATQTAERKEHLNMLKKLLFNLQLFGEGGDGGDGGSANSSGEGVVDTSGEDKVLASIPEKAKKYYEKAVLKTSQKKDTQVSQPQTTTTEQEKTTTEHIPYADLIKSDDYKEEHKAYMDKTIKERFKKYNGLEESLGQHKGLLEIVANKYGVNPDDENFLGVLKEKIEADDSYYENYAMEHDISTDEARRIVTMERKVAQIEAQKQEQERQEQQRQFFMTLQQNAQKTKAQFPEFDLDTAFQDENFRKLCFATHGDTTASYMACNYNSIIPNAVRTASEQAKIKTAQSVASNKARPIENGISSSAPSVVQQDFRNMSLQQLRAYADEQRRKNGR